MVEFWTILCIQVKVWKFFLNEKKKFKDYLSVFLMKKSVKYLSQKSELDFITFSNVVSLIFSSKKFQLESNSCSNFWWQ